MTTRLIINIEDYSVELKMDGEFTLNVGDNLHISDEYSSYRTFVIRNKSTTLNYITNKAESVSWDTWGVVTDVVIVVDVIEVKEDK